MSKEGLIVQKKYDELNVEVYATRELMGKASAQAGIAKLKELLAKKDNVRVIFAAAPSANELLAGLCEDKEIDWSRVTAFHMDEYIGLPADAPQLFSNFLRNAIWDKVKPGQVHIINGLADPVEECARYNALLKEAPIDIVFMGIGENGHIAFNDPPVADFEDPASIKVVRLDHACRQQQVNDGCFATLDDVPTHALTLTIPTLLSGDHLFCIVPNERKHPAVKAALTGPISTECPASILRTQSKCTLFLDADSYGDLA